MTGLLKRIMDAIVPPDPMTDEEERKLKHLLSQTHEKTAKVDVAKRQVFVRPNNMDTFKTKCTEAGLTGDVITDTIDYLRANPKEYFIFQS